MRGSAMEAVGDIAATGQSPVLAGDSAARPLALVTALALARGGCGPRPDG